MALGLVDLLGALGAFLGKRRGSGFGGGFFGVGWGVVSEVPGVSAKGSCVSGLSCSFLPCIVSYFLEGVGEGLVGQKHSGWLFVWEGGG